MNLLSSRPKRPLIWTSAIILLSTRDLDGTMMVLPGWVLLVSLHILVGNLRAPMQGPATAMDEKNHD